ncbi:hypothetical protein GCM10009742_59130 [Kribbella karoonensis]|uniref:Uncharacterized protein n=1 Tax=Kribbella karoonensis TaxID=324851 RepID=A0ABN2EDH7_9ACTN
MTVVPDTPFEHTVNFLAAEADGLQYIGQRVRRGVRTAIERIGHGQDLAAEGYLLGEVGEFGGVADGVEAGDLAVFDV